MYTSLTHPAYGMDCSRQTTIRRCHRKRLNDKELVSGDGGFRRIEIAP